MQSFAEALSNFDNIIVTDIYAAREKDVFGVSSEDLVDKIVKLGKDAKYIGDFEEIVKYVKENAKKGDIVITLGAGTVTDIGPMLIEEK